MLAGALTCASALLLKAWPQPGSADMGKRRQERPVTGHTNGARDSGEPAASAACSLGVRRTVKMSLQRRTAGVSHLANC